MKWAKMCRILAASMVLPLSAGCWDRLEINDLALVMATGLDEAEDGQVKLSVQIFVPKKAGDTPNVGGDQASGGGGGGSQTIVKEATGISVADAVSRLQTMMSRRLTWEHDEVFIFGEKRAAHGIEEDMDYLLRSRQTRERANLFVSEGMAIDALRLNPRLERRGGDAAGDDAIADRTRRLSVQAAADDAKRGQVGGIALYSKAPESAGREPGQHGLVYYGRHRAEKR